MLLPLVKLISSCIVWNVWIALPPTHATEYILVMPPMPKGSEARLIFHTLSKLPFSVTANVGEKNFVLQHRKPKQITINITKQNAHIDKGNCMKFVGGNDFQLNIYMVFNGNTFDVFIPVPVDAWASSYFAFSALDIGGFVTVLTKETTHITVSVYTQKTIFWEGREMPEGSTSEIDHTAEQYTQINLCYENPIAALSGAELKADVEFGAIIGSCSPEHFPNLFNAIMLFNTDVTTQLYITPHTMMGNLLVDIVLSASFDSIATVHTKNSLPVETFNFILRKARMINIHACKGPCIVMSQDLLKLYMVVTKPGAGNSYCLLTPVELFSTYYSIDTPTSEGLRHFVILIVRHQQRLHININGQQAARKIPKWEYAECEQVFLLGLVEIPDGNHYLDGSGFVNFGCYVYGSSEEQSLYFSNPLVKVAHRDIIGTPIVGNPEEQRYCREKKYFAELLPSEPEASSTSTTKQTTGFLTVENTEETQSFNAKCEDRFFGHRCSHYCGCAEEQCTADGNCIDNAACVDNRLFGSRCLFFDIMSTSVLKDVIPDMRDAPATKCSEVSSILIEFRTVIYFDFLYIKLSTAVDEKLPFEIAFSNLTDRLSPCSVPRLVKLSETEIRVTCSSKIFVNQIFVNFNALTVCVHSIKCSSGIDVAVGESTELYINSVQNTHKKSMIMLPIIQNKTKNSACLYEFYPGKSLSWVLKFKVPKRVNYIWMALGQMTVDENNPIVVEIYNKSDQLLYSQSVTFGRSSYEIHYTRTHLVSKIKVFAENGDLTLCDFMAIGDCAADKTGLYCDLPCTCIDECFIDGSCYTATGNLTNLQKSISITSTGRSGMWWRIAIITLFSIIALSALVVIAFQLLKKNKKPSKKIKKSASSSSGSSLTASSGNTKSQHGSSAEGSDNSLSSPEGSNMSISTKKDNQI